MDLGLTKKKPATPAPTQEFDAARFYTWVKAIESKLNGLRREFELLKNNTTKHNSEVKHDVITINQDFVDFKHSQEKIKENMDLIIKEIKRTAGKEELDVLKKYMEFWNPMHFVTEKDVERLIDQRLADRETSKIKTSDSSQSKESKDS